MEKYVFVRITQNNNLRVNNSHICSSKLYIATHIQSFNDSSSLHFVKHKILKAVTTKKILLKYGAV
jgi:hypothetical protein